ncbi:MAG: hypothetical protein ACTSSJ_05445 [Candidatus Odinarchaeia archaeon]
MNPTNQPSTVFNYLEGKNRNFLVLNPAKVSITKKAIDKGRIPYNIVKIVNCIRNAILLSNSIRRDTCVTIFNLQYNGLVSYDPSKLRYLGTDERSGAVLYMKALNLLKQLNTAGFVESTPGIYAAKIDFLEYLSILKKRGFNLILIDKTASREYAEIKISKPKAFIIKLNKNLRSEYLNKIKEIGCIEVRLDCLNNPEHIILLLNYLHDKSTKTIE